MIINPAILAMMISGILVTGYAVYASIFGLRINHYWDLASGSEQQLMMERRTHLISTIMAYLLALNFFSACLFIYTADHMHILFVGAMCAAGTLNADPNGYPALVLKVVNIFLGGMWLIINHLDNQGSDYPLIRFKYRFLIVFTLLLILETWLAISYFRGLEADLITSCCGTLFSTEGDTLMANLAALPSYITQVLLFLTTFILLRTGLHFLFTERGGRLFGYISLGQFILGLAAVISVISVYFYELPTHHCPFCLLQREYHFIGYPLYLALFCGGIAGVGTGWIERYRRIPSLSTSALKLQKRLCVWAMVGYIVFSAIAAYPMIFSDFVLVGN